MDNNYVVVVEEYMTILSIRVNELIERGYVPCGGIAVTGDNFSQAMIRKECLE